MTNKEIAVFGGGCFWCTEAIFQQLRGVESVTSGYAGGTTANPNYYEVAMGRTGHAEVVRVEYDPAQIAYEDLLSVFFVTHDPTQLNGQGNDIGTQYRSIILYTSEEQKQVAEQFLQKLRDDQAYSGPIVTELKFLDKFYEAEPEHKDYYLRNRGQPYCQVIINPKLKKLKEKFAALIKK